MSVVSLFLRPLCGVSSLRRRPLLVSVVALFLMVSFGTYVRLRSSSGVNSDITSWRVSGFDHRDLDGRTPPPLEMRNVRPGEGDGTYRYVLSMNYWEQFSNALRNYLSLSCVADEWRARVIRPFTSNSRFYGLPDIFLDEHFNKSHGVPLANDLSLILDINSLDSVLYRAGIRASTSLDEMLKYGDRKLIFLHFVSVISHREYSIKSPQILSALQEAFKHSNIVDCLEQKELNSLSRLVSSNLNSRLTSSDNNNQFYPFKYLCVNASQEFNPSKVAELLGFGTGNVSLIIVNWRGAGNATSIIKSSHGVHANKRISLGSQRCLDKHTNKARFYSVQLSQTVLEASKKFMNELGVSEGDFVVVHFRSEKLTFRESRFPRLLANCVSEAVSKKDEIINKVGVANKVLYFADIGDFGSDTCKSCSSVKKMQILAKKYDFSFSHFSPLTYDLPMDRGFVAAVEMSVMSHASHVILVGGGSFQANLQMRYNAIQGQLKTRKKAITMCNADTQASIITKKYSPPD